MRRFFMEQCGQPEMAAALLDAAMRLFARKGFAATTVREIVGEASATSPMLYYYFQSKEGLFRALVRALIGSFDAQLDQALGRDCPLREKLSDMARSHLEMARELPMALRFMLSASVAPREELSTIEQTQRIALLTKLARIFEEAAARGEFTPGAGMTPMYLAQSFLGMLTSQLLFAMKLAELHPLNDELTCIFERATSAQSAQDMLDLFFHGAGTLHAPGSP